MRSVLIIRHNNDNIMILYYYRVAAATSNIVSLTFRVSGDHLPTDDFDINERLARACRRRRRRLYQRHTDWRSFPPRWTRHWTAPWRTRRADGPRAVDEGGGYFFLRAAWRDDHTRCTRRCLVVSAACDDTHLFSLYFYSWIIRHTCILLLLYCTECCARDIWLLGIRSAVVNNSTVVKLYISINKTTRSKLLLQL